MDLSNIFVRGLEKGRPPGSGVWFLREWVIYCRQLKICIYLAI
jgi:hypothetical protein